MVEFTRVLCPLDFSEPSSRALKYAAAIARSYDSELVLQHVLPTAITFAWTPDIANQPALVVSPERALGALRDQVAAAGAADLRSRFIVHEGIEHEAITTLARDEGADLLVIGTHGRRGFNRLFLGSVTEKVIRTAPCPVLTVPAAAAAVPPTPVRFKRILCAMDYSPAARRGLDYAFELGRQAGGEVTVMWVCEYSDPMEPPPYVDAVVRAARQHILASARERLHQLVGGEATTRCAIKELVVLHPNRAAHAILEAASTLPADLIVMGAQGSGGVELMLYGSNTHHVVRNALCPVLTLRS